VRFNAAALAALQAYRWPGNVRELANLIERMAVQCGEHPVSPADLPERYRPADWRAEPVAVDPETLTSAPSALTTRTAVTSITPSTSVAAVPAAAAVTAAGAQSAAPVTAATTPGAPGSAEEAPPMAPPLLDMMLEPIPEGFDLRAYLETLEQRLIERALQSSGGTVAQAARLLGLRRTTLVEKLRKYAPDSDAAAASDS
jgi:sigma-54 specific flagellar transcriptional regulator A